MLNLQHRILAEIVHHTQTRVFSVDLSILAPAQRNWTLNDQAWPPTDRFIRHFTWGGANTANITVNMREMVMSNNLWNIPVLKYLWIRNWLGKRFNFRICSTDLCADGRKGKTQLNLQIIFKGNHLTKKATVNVFSAIHGLTASLCSANLVKKVNTQNLNHSQVNIGQRT